MEYLVVLVIAFFSKAFFNSALCRGDYSFFKTYFVYGSGGAFALYFGIMFVFGYSAFNNDRGPDLDALTSAASLGLFCLAIYLAGIALAVYRIKSKGQFSALMNVYAVLILVAFILVLPSAVFRVPELFMVYAAAVFVLFRFRWGNVFIEKLG